MKKKQSKQHRAWEDVPHSPTPWRDCGAGVVADDLGRVVFSYKPSHYAEAALRDFMPFQRMPPVYGDYHFLLCAANCHDGLLAAAKRLVALLGKAPKKNADEIAKLNLLIAHAESNFD